MAKEMIALEKKNATLELVHFPSRKKRLWDVDGCLQLNIKLMGIGKIQSTIICKRVHVTPSNPYLGG